MAARSQRGSQMGTMLVLIGVAGVLGVTFVAGVWTGRHWPLLTGEASSADGSTGRRAAPERPRQAEPLPALTFYHELTAPLTAPPPAPKPTRPVRPPEPRRDAEKPEARREPERPDRAPATATATPSAATPASRYTVQVGAYNARTPAEALRTTLAAAGHDARVVEAGTPGGVRYRVHVGSFATREAARDAATRLAAERSLPAFVTTR